MKKHCLLLIIQSVLLVITLGCKSEDPEPQLKDPIYLDLKRELDRASGEASALEAKILKLEGDYSKTEVRTIDRKTVKMDLIKAKKAYQLAIQSREYYEARLKLREARARVAYKRAFLAEKPWPDPAEFESYQLQKKLRQNSRNWADRVPKRGDTHEDIVSPPDSAPQH